MERDDQERIIELEVKLEQQEKRIIQLLELTTSIRTELTRYKGFIGGFLFLGSTILTLAELFRDYLFRH